MPFVRSPDSCDIEARGTSGQRLGRERTSRVDPRLLRKLWAEYHDAPWPQGLFACHHCDEPRCSNPEHVFPGSAKDNTHDSINKGRHFRMPGDLHWRTHLSWSDIEHIKQLAFVGVSQREIGRRFNVHQSEVSRIVNGRRWRQHAICVA